MPKEKSNSKAPFSLGLLAEGTKCTAVQLSKLQGVALQQISLIRQLHTDAALRAILAGFALHRVKAELKRGEFMPWVKKELDGTGYRQANYYMRLAISFAEVTRISKPELLALPVDSTELALETTDVAARKFMEKAKLFVGDKSLNELLAEHGIKDHGKLGGAREKSVNGTFEIPTPEQLYVQSRDEIGGVIFQAENLLLKENRLQHLIGHPDEVRGVVESLRTLADKVEKAARPILKK